MDNMLYGKDKVSLLMRDGSRVEGYLEFFHDNDLNSAWKTKTEEGSFLKINQARVFLPTQQVVNMPWILINRLFVAECLETL